MNASFLLKANLPLTVLVFLASSFWQAGGGKSALADEDPLDAIIEAHRTSCKKIESATGSGTYELYRREADEKEAKLCTKATVDVQFADGKYNLHIDYETLLEYSIYKNTDGTETKKLVEWKPDNFFVIDNGTSRIEVKFTERIKPAGCAGEIRADRLNPASPWRDLAQLSKRIDPEGYVKNIGRDKLTVTQLPNGIFRVTGRLKNSPNVRFEFEADSKVGLNIVAERVYNEPNKEPAHSQDITWKQKDDIWYGEHIVEVIHRLNSDGTAGTSTRSVLKYDDFTPNAKVAPAVFTLAATGVPRGARFHDRRPGAPNRLLYYDGIGLTPEKPGRP